MKVIVELEPSEIDLLTFLLGVHVGQHITDAIMRERLLRLVDKFGEAREKP